MFLFINPLIFSLSSLTLTSSIYSAISSSILPLTSLYRQLLIYRYSIFSCFAYLLIDYIKSSSNANLTKTFRSLVFNLSKMFKRLAKRKADISSKYLQEDKATNFKSFIIQLLKPIVAKLVEPIIAKLVKPIVI